MSSSYYWMVMRYRHKDKPICIRTVKPPVVLMVEIGDPNFSMAADALLAAMSRHQPS